MATNDTELKAEVLDLTDNEGILDDSDMSSLLSIAKQEIEIEVGEDNPDFYANPKLERSLFWLTSFFTKIKTGEYEGMSFSVSEIEVEQVPEDDNGSFWFRQFNKRIRQYRVSDRTFVTSISRQNRTYGDN